MQERNSCKKVVCWVPKQRGRQPACWDANWHGGNLSADACPIWSGRWQLFCRVQRMLVLHNSLGTSGKVYPCLPSFWVLLSNVFWGSLCSHSMGSSRKPFIRFVILHKHLKLLVCLRWEGDVNMFCTWGNWDADKSSCLIRLLLQTDGMADSVAQKYDSRDITSHSYSL